MSGPKTERQSKNVHHCNAEDYFSESQFSLKNV